MRPIAKTIYYKAFRLGLRMRLWVADRLDKPGVDVPIPPAILRFRVTESISIREFLQIGAGCASLIREHLGQMGVDFADAQRVLDFGCGCGRAIRWFLASGETAEFHGVDVDAQAIDWCKKYLRPGRFFTTPISPPLPYPAEHFDAIYCLSVFTHLSESMQDDWLAELQRILRPGGVLLLTVYGAAATEVLNEEDRTLPRKVGFVHKRSGKLKGLVPDWYQTSFHSRQYILARLSKGFSEQEYHAVPDGMQDVIVARK